MTAPDRPTAARFANAGMILAQSVVGLIGLGLAGLATWGCVLAAGEVGGRPGRGGMPWWAFVSLAAVTAAAWFVPIACAAGILRRAQPPPPPAAPLAPRRRFARRLRGAALAAVSVLLTLGCLTVAFFVLSSWWADRFRQLPRLTGEWYFWAGAGLYSLVTTASALGLWSGGRRMLRPPPEPEDPAPAADGTLWEETRP